MKLAVLGTGVMGTGMTRTLLREGFDVSVWNRTRARAEPLARDGAVVASSAADAVRDVDAVITMLFDADSVLDVIAAADLPDGCIWVQSATIGLEGTRRAARLASDRDLATLDAPVLGSKGPAEQGTLVQLVSGDPQVVRRLQPVFDAVGTKTVVAGPKLGQATALKLACNAWIAALTTALGQSLALADRLGVDSELFLEALGGGPMDLPYAHVKAPLMLAGDYPVAFALDGAVKDLTLMTAAAQEAGVPDDLLGTLLHLYREASGAGHGGEDMAAIRTVFDRTTGDD